MKNFIPNFIAEQASNNIPSGTFAASAMFIDISGFTSMTQSLMGHGKEGAEVLSNIINNIFTPSIKAIYDNGGFVSTFAGDAFTAIFEIEKADHALKAAFEINKLFVDAGKINTKFGEFELAVKIGLSHGVIEFGIIDAEVQKAYYFRGEAVDNCAKSEHLAEKMQIVADRKFIEELSVKVERQSKEEHRFILTPKELDLSPIQRKPGFVIPEEIEKHFVPDVVLNMKDRGEFREIVSVFIGFEESDGYAESIKQVIKNTHAYGGYFNKIDFGDKGGVMLVIFGAPTGREKLYSRAADFALSLKEIQGFSFRAGLSTGIAFCGIIGSDLRKEYTALGNVVNLSARLMTKAGQNSILAGPGISTKLPSSYKYESRGLTEFKGFSEKLEVFELKGKTTTTQKMTYSGSFVGRKKEADELRKMIQPIFENKFGGIVYIDGPAGIGKSRFIDNFVKNLDDCASFYLPCDEILRKSFNPFEYFFKGYFEQSEAVLKEENKENFTRKFAELVSQTTDDEIKSELIRTESVIGALIGLEWENSLFSQLDAKGRYENTLYAVKNFFLAESLIKPVVLVLEDAHWADNDSLALTETLIRNVEKYPFVILALCRPNDDGSVFDLLNPEKADISLNRLNIESFNKEMMNELLKDRFSAENIPDKTSDFVWEKSNGNPFFVEQLVLYLTENNLLDNSMNLVSEASSIPSGISQIIIARIDRLSAQMKETVKTASVLGREFALRVLEKMLGSKITTDQTILEAGEIEQIWENLTELKYIFKHALIRDAVYEVQLKESLRKLHDLAGNIIEELYSDNLKEHYDELADHYYKAEIKTKAIEYLEKAGDQAKENYKNQKALDLFEKLVSLTLDKEYYSVRIEALSKKADVLICIGKWDEAIRVFDEGIELSLSGSDLMKETALKIRKANLLGTRGLPDESEELLKHSIEKAKESGLETNVMEGYYNLGTLYEHFGDYKEAGTFFKIYMDYAIRSDDSFLIAKAKYRMSGLNTSLHDFDTAEKLINEALELFSEDGKLLWIGKCYTQLAYIHRCMGRFEKAMDFYDKSLEIMKKTGDKNGISIVLNSMAVTYSLSGDNDKFMKYTKENMKLFRDLGDKNGLATVLSNIGIFHGRNGEFQKALACFNKCLEIRRSLREKPGIASALCNIALVYLEKGDYESSVPYNDEYLKISEEMEDRSHIACAMINRGVIYKNRGDLANALKCYDKAIDNTRELGLVYDLIEYLQLKIDLFMENNMREDAKPAVDESLEIAEQMKIPAVIFNTRITRHRIYESENGLLNMITEEDEDSENTAVLYHNLYKMTKKTEYKEKALNIYKLLYSEKDINLYSSRIKDLEII